MKKSTVVKWIVLSTAVTAAAAFAAGVAYELRSIKKLTVDIDEDDEMKSDSVDENDAEPSATSEDVAETSTEE